MNDKNFSATFESSRIHKLYASASLVLGYFFGLLLLLLNLKDEAPIPILLVFIIMFVVGVIYWFKKPKRLIIATDGIRFNGKHLKWSSINKITYGRDTGNKMSRVIEIFEGELETYIYPDTFKDGEDIGILISKLAEKNGVKVVLNKY